MEELEVFYHDKLPPSIDDIIAVSKNKKQGFKLKGLSLNNYEEALYILESCPNTYFNFEVKDKAKMTFKEAFAQMIVMHGGLQQNRDDDDFVQGKGVEEIDSFREDSQMLSEKDYTE